MDQESFRKLLQTPHRASDTSNASTTFRGSELASTSKQKKTLEPSQPVFKPRKVKKEKEQKYRDRAAERRIGEGNDYAQVEALLEDFERRTAHSEDKNAVEEQRKYLGGDGDHSILVKGLDIALLEQNKARVAFSMEDDDSLEQAFIQVSSESSAKKKRTREDLIRELKEKRHKDVVEAVNGRLTKAEEEARLLEDAKKAGRFKPIGLPVDEKPKRKKGKEKDGERKKKRKLDGSEVKVKEILPGEITTLPAKNENEIQLLPPPPAPPVPPAEPESGPLTDDFDIFVGAGEYEGVDLGDDDDDDGDDRPKDDTRQDDEPATSAEIQSTGGRWFATETAETNNTGSKSKSDSTTSNPAQIRNEEGEEEQQPLRLVPLETSALPHIKDFLAEDEAAEKRRKYKDKRKGGKGGGEKKLSAEAKAERDYKKLQSYKEKKAGA